MAPSSNCVICGLAQAKYKCPRCKIDYCSVACFKKHKECEPDCGPPSKQEQQQVVVNTDTSPDANETKTIFDELLEDEAIKYYLKFPALKFHLQSIVGILNDAQVSGEHDSFGRRQVALKKLGQLREGGKEQNELVEEFVSRVLELYNSKT